MTGLFVALGTLALALLAGLALRAREGRVRQTADPSPVEELPGQVVSALAPAPEITLVQISTSICAPCRHARTRLSALAERTPGLRHVELDVTDRVEVAKELGVLRTPTTIAYTGEGQELFRVHGVPESRTLGGQLQPHLPGASHLVDAVSASRKQP